MSYWKINSSAVGFAVLTQQKRKREREKARNGLLHPYGKDCWAPVIWALDSELAPWPSWWLQCMWKVKFVDNIKILGRFFPSIRDLQFLFSCSGHGRTSSWMVALVAGSSTCPCGGVWWWEGGRQGTGERHQQVPPAQLHTPSQPEHWTLKLCQPWRSDKTPRRPEAETGSWKMVEVESFTKVDQLKAYSQIELDWKWKKKIK